MIAAPACWIEIGLDRESEVALPSACRRQPWLACGPGVFVERSNACFRRFPPSKRRRDE